ncbi:uncharacterized protein LOC129702998 [Leucoraja erinacea]|uniref:uncharacterized protein LOC129702998 n=1 Tax=Leucoraja erinaceus TaxID=7782 RepID=UPI0024576E1B|nr:uncharacterized protein LOC129702998 [Leucoraja erinacea]
MRLSPVSLLYPATLPSLPIPPTRNKGRVPLTPDQPSHTTNNPPTFSPPPTRSHHWPHLPISSRQLSAVTDSSVTPLSICPFPSKPPHLLALSLATAGNATHDCVPAFDTNTIVKFADDTTVIGLITNGDETKYRAEVLNLADWCSRNNLSLNTFKTKEQIIDVRRSHNGEYAPISIYGDSVERVSSFKFLGTHISEDLAWSTNTAALVKKAQQRLFFLRTLKKTGLPQQLLTTFYRCTTESILTYGISVWYLSCTEAERRALQRVVHRAQRIIGTQLPALEGIYHTRSLRKAVRIHKDSSHPCNGLFELLPSGRRYKAFYAQTSTQKQLHSQSYSGSEPALLSAPHNPWTVSLRWSRRTVYLFILFFDIGWKLLTKSHCTDVQ